MRYLKRRANTDDYCTKQRKHCIKGASSTHEKTNERLEDLEREQNRNLQYLRRDTIEISGIPANIDDKHLEDEVLNLYDIADVSVHGRKVTKHDIQACHRIGKKGVTIVKFLNRKFANERLYCGRNLKGNSPYTAQVYINSSLCREYKFLNLLIRKAKREGELFRYKVRKGITSVQMTEGDKFP